MAFWNRKPKNVAPAVDRVAPVIETDQKKAGSVLRSWRAGEWNDLTADWGITSHTPYSLTLQHLSMLRARARQEYRTNDYARRFVQMLQNGVVGPDGFRLQAQFEDARGRDTVANEAFEKHWRKWAENPLNVDVRGRLDFNAICRQIVTSLATDGEAFVVWQQTGAMNYQLYVLDPALVDLTYQEDLRNGNRIRFGIEYNGNHQMVAVWVNDGSINQYQYSYNTGQRRRIEATRVYHVFQSDMADQYRGWPWLSTPMYRMHMLDGFEENAAINARAGAAKQGFKRQRDPERYAGESGQGAGVEVTKAGVAVDYLNENEEWVSHNPDYPTGEFRDYVKTMLRGVSAGLGVSYNTLANDLEGVNFTSLRHDSLYERDVFKGLQNWLGGYGFCKRVYADWVRAQVLITGVPIPRNGGGSRPANAATLDKWMMVHFQGRRWAWVQPREEAEANTAAVKLAVRTRSQIIRDAGMDPEEVFKEWEAENERFGPIDAEPATAEQDAGTESDDQPEGNQSGREDG